MSILLIAGSPSERSRSAALLEADVAHCSVSQAIDQVDRARAIVVGTPVYKAGYSGFLKVFLDLLPQLALKGKLVLPLATGCTPGRGDPGHQGLSDQDGGGAEGQEDRAEQGQQCRLPVGARAGAARPENHRRAARLPGPAPLRLQREAADPEVGADQQRLTDAFYAHTLIPKATQVREAVVVPQL